MRARRACAEKRYIFWLLSCWRFRARYLRFVNIRKYCKIFTTDMMYRRFRTSFFFTSKRCRMVIIYTSEKRYNIVWKQFFFLNVNGKSTGVKMIFNQPFAVLNYKLVMIGYSLDIEQMQFRIHIRILYRKTIFTVLIRILLKRLFSNTHFMGCFWA